LLQDGYTSKVVRLDNAEDVALCEETLSPAIGPDIKAADARSMVPQCIISFNSSYVLVLGGHGQVQQHQGGSYAGYVFYTDDYYADLNGDKVPELPIGRLPDGNPPGDNTVRVALQTATRLHQAAGWQSGGSHLAWTLDNPRGHGSPTNEHIECMVQAIDANNAINCNVDPDCYFAPPYNTQQAGTPSDWGIATDLLFVLGHGNPTGLQEFADHDPQRVRMGTASTIAQRDFTDTVLFYNPCFGGRIHNHDFAESSVLQALNKGAVAVFGGTTLQSYSATDMNSCNMLPISSMSHGSSFLTNLAYGINKAGATTIGDAWLYWHNRVTVRAQREHNVMYADPSIRVK
jgi:hypothetical protein